MLNKTKQHENLLKLYKGHGFEISDVNIRSVNSNRSVGIYLGNNSGAEASFMGTISRVNILSDGGTGIYTGDSNTSLNFTNCYFMGCSWQIKGTVYSSWTNCAVDNSPDNAYNISGGKYSKAHTLTFISCGAEKSQKSAWYFESGVYSVEIIAPLSGINNISKASNVGELATFNNIGTNQLTNIKISSPVVMVNDNNWDIYVTNGKTGKITIENIYSEAFTNKIGSKDWEISKNLIVK